MTRIAKILGPVPPLDDASRGRLERNVLAALDRPAPAARAQVWPWAAAGAAALAAVAVLLLWPGGRALHRGGSERTYVEPGGSVADVADGVRLDRGAAWFYVTHRPDRIFRVHAGDVVIEDVGTKFRVAIDGDRVTVQVTEGEVAITANGATTHVGAGGRWPAITAVAPPPVAPPRPVVVTTPPPAAPKKHVDPQARYEEAMSLARKDPVAAAAILRTLARRSDSWGATALFALSQLEAGAARTRDLEAYLRRFPDGLNAEDVRLLLHR